MSADKTQCPACTTQFLVTTEQMQAHGGMVRCGQCSHVFNAYEQMVDPIVSPMSTADEDLDDLFAPSSSVPEVKARIEQPMMIDTTDDEPFGHSDDMELSATFAAINEQDDLMRLDEPTEEFNHTEANMMSVGDFDGLDLTSETSALKESDYLRSASREQEPVDPLDQEMLSEDPFKKATKGSNAEETHPEFGGDPDLTGFLSGIGAHTAQFNSLSNQVGKTSQLRNTESVHRRPVAKSTRTNPNPPRVFKTIFWTLMSLVAIFGMAAQYLYYNFDKFSQDSTYVPLLEMACGVIGCQLPSADASQVVLDELDWFVNDDNMTQVRFTVGSRADEPMLLPFVEMQLYRGDELIGASVLSPDDYLVGDFNRLPMLNPLDGEVVLQNVTQSFDRIELRPLY